MSTETINPDNTTDDQDAPQKLALDVNVENVGPCRKHVRVRIPAADIQRYRDDAVREFATSAAVPGFRVGRVPKELVERRFRKELSDQVRQKLLLESLEQLGDDNSIDPINEPEFNIESLTIPETGDFEYEFDVEVRPEFDMPNYAGLKIKRSVREIGESHVNSYLDKLRSEYAEHSDADKAAAPGDFVRVRITTQRGDEQPHTTAAQVVQLLPTLRFRDGELGGFDTLMTGVKAGESRSADVAVSQEAPQIELRGESVKVTFEVEAVVERKLPELDQAFADQMGFESIEDLRDEVTQMLQRQTLFQQRQETRKQVLEQITASASWDLPESLVSKQTENALRREILEMQQAGFTTGDIRNRENEIRQRSISTTRQALKEHFVLDKIATEQNIEVSPVEIETEIQTMAFQRGENPRRLRARLVKSGVIENLDAQIRERKAVDYILSQAVFEDQPMPEEAPNSVAGVDASLIWQAPPAAAEQEDEGEGDE